MHPIDTRHANIRPPRDNDKLSPDQVIYVREQRAMKHPLADLSAELGVHVSTVSRAARGRSYRRG